MIRLLAAVLPFGLLQCAPEPTPTERFIARAAELGATPQEQERFRLVIEGPTRPCRWGESTGRTDARNGRHHGLAQVSTLHLPALGMTVNDLYEPERNAEASMHVLRLQGWRAWSCAERAWGREGRA